MSEVCLCWVGHGGCGGCSGVIGIKHEPICGWECNPECSAHGDRTDAAYRVMNATTNHKRKEEA